MEFSGFDWDEGNRAKCRKHGVAIEIIEGIFRRGLTILPDAAHSQDERRFRGIGRTEQGRAVFVVFTLRERAADVLIRPISARYMHKKEAEHYGKSNKA
jgi:hypothetical protein